MDSAIMTKLMYVVYLLITLIYSLLKEKKWKYRVLVIALFVAMLLWVRADYINSTRQSAEAEKRVTSIKEEMKSTTEILIADNRMILDSLRNYKTQLEKWQKKTPLAKVESALEMRLLGQEKISDTLIQTGYLFRAESPMPLRDISISLTFDNPLLGVNWRIAGAVVFEQGTAEEVSDDSTSIEYFTGYLSSSNDIILEVISRKPLGVIDVKLEP